MRRLALIVLQTSGPPAKDHQNDEDNRHGCAPVMLFMDARSLKKGAVMLHLMLLRLRGPWLKVVRSY